MAGDDDDWSEDEEGSPSGGRRRPVGKALFLAAPALALALAGGGWLYVSGRLAPLLGYFHAETASAPAVAPQPAYYDLPAILVNVRASGGGQAYLKLSATLALQDGSARAAVDADLPLVVDSLIVELWNLPIEDFKNAAAMDSLRADLLTQLSIRLKPVVVRDILFKEVVISMGG